MGHLGSVRFKPNAWWVAGLSLTWVGVFVGSGCAELSRTLGIVALCGSLFFFLAPLLPCFSRSLFVWKCFCTAR